MTVKANFNNKVYVVPGSASKIDSTALNTTSLGYSGIVAIVGPCTSGVPKVPVLFNSPSQLKSALGSGNAYDGARMAFNPSVQIVEGNSVRPQLVYVVRADSATQSTITLNDASANPSLVFTSLDYGYQTNNVAVQITPALDPSSQQYGNPGANDGAVNIILTYGTITEVYSNVGITPVFYAYYTGAGSAVISFNVTDPGTTLPCVSVTANSVTTYYDYAIYPTVLQLVNALNTISGMVASGNPLSNTSSYAVADLDYVSTVTIGTTAPTKTGFYGVIKDALAKINGFSGLVTVAKATNAALPPNSTYPGGPYATPVYFTGGTTTAPGTSDYQAALLALQKYRVNFVAIADDIANAGPSIFSGWLDSMQGVNECHGHCGTTIVNQQKKFSDLQAIVSSINDVNVNFWTDAVLLPNDQGVNTLYDSWMAACMAAGFQGGTPPGSSFVEKSFSILGTSHYIDPTNDELDPYVNADAMILARFSFLRFNDATKSFMVVRALTTYTLDDNDYNTEPGIRSATNYAVYSIRQDVEQKYLGARTLFNEAGSTADSVRGEIISYGKLLEGAKVIVKGSEYQNNTKVILPALIIDSVTVSADILRARYAIRPIGSINFIFHDISLMPVQQVS